MLMYEIYLLKRLLLFFKNIFDDVPPHVAKLNLILSNILKVRKGFVSELFLFPETMFN